MTTRDAIVAEARKWIDTPWRHTGRNRRGIDCVGLGVVVCQALAITRYDVRTYSRVPAPGLLDHLRLVADEISPADVLPGDFVCMLDSAYPFHIAFVAEKDGRATLIHAVAARRRVVEEPYSDEWRHRTLNAFRFKGLHE